MENETENQIKFNPFSKSKLTRIQTLRSTNYEFISSTIHYLERS